MANRTKRLQQEAERLREAEKFAAALRRVDKTPSVPRIRKRRPERSLEVNRLRGDINEFWFNAKLDQIAGFRTSDAFADYLLSSRPLVRALIQRPLYIIYLVYIYSKMEPCRPTKDWRPPKSACPERVLESYMLHHFVRYQYSKPLMKAWIVGEGDYEHMINQQFVHMAMGGSFRKMPYMPAGFTARMGHLLLHAPKSFSWEHAIAWAYLCGLGLSPLCVQKILHRFNDNHFFIISPTQLPLWRFLMRNPDICDKDIYRIITFYKHQTEGKHNVVNAIQRMTLEVEALYPRLNIQGATPASILRKVDIWEAHLRAIIRKPYTAELPATNVKGIEYFLSYNQTPLVIRQITQPLDLLREGRAMRHCVASYLEGCVKGKCSIWVVRQGESRLATIELRPDKMIYQVKGRFNEMPEKPVVDAVNAWCRQESLKLFEY